MTLKVTFAVGTFLSLIPREIQHVLSTVCTQTNQKAHVACNFYSMFLKMKDFSRSQPVTCTVDVLIFLTVPDGVVVTTD